MGYELCKLGRYGRAHDQDGILNARLAEGDSLIDGGDAESVNGEALQRLGNLQCPMSVGVGFDNGQDVGMRSESSHMGDILCEGSQVDGSESWGGFGRLVHAVSDNRFEG